MRSKRHMLSDQLFELSVDVLDLKQQCICIQEREDVDQEIIWHIMLIHLCDESQI